MGNIIYKGKEYREVEAETQKAMHEIGIHTFYYYPLDRLMIISDKMAAEFNCEKLVEDMPQAVRKFLFHEADVEKIMDMDRRLRSGSNKVSSNFKVASGRNMRFTLTVVERNENGDAKTCVGLAEDLSEDMRQADLIQALGLNYQSVYYLDFDKDIIYPYRLSEPIEAQYGDFFRSHPSYEMAITAYVLNTVYEEERQEMLMMCSQKFIAEQLKDQKVFVHDYRAFRDGRIVYCRMKYVDVSKEPGMHEVVAGFADISKDKRREIEHYAYVDALTGGDNYNRFKESLREMKRTGYLISMDVHNFKLVNLACGTKRGDATLKEIWKCIKANLGPLDLAGHINADHFAIFLQTEEESVVTDKLEVIIKAMEKLSYDMDIPLMVPYFGITKWSADKGIEIAYGEANTAKHEAKDRNDIHYTFYSEADSERMIQEKLMTDAFADAITKRRFEVWYQGKFDPNTGKLTGAEALTRWRKEDGRLISPGIFIPLFEKTGQIRILDEYVFRSVCEMQKNFLDEGRELFPISVNLSRATMYFRNVVNIYRKITEEVGIDPKYVPIEITESAAVANGDIKGLAADFYAAGFPLCLDDFGTGYSSLATLNILHFDTLKLDKSLIDFIGESDGDILIKHTIALAKDLGMHVTAEGVEEESQKEFLRNQNCDSIQGFYYAKPMPIDEFRGLL